MGALLWHIQISHYSEKARWALDLKRVPHVRRRALWPGTHIPVALWLTRGSNPTFPVLELDGRRIGDSTAIIAALEELVPDPPLYPEDPAERRRALALEDYFDETLGPSIRRLAFIELGRDPARFAELATRMGPPALRAFPGAVGAYARAFTALRFGARAGAADAARSGVLTALDRLEAELGDGDYLVAGRFGVADLTAAALFYPLVVPPEGPREVGEMPAEYERFRDGLRERRGWRWVEEMFRRHRRG